MKGAYPRFDQPLADGWLKKLGIRKQLFNEIVSRLVRERDDRNLVPGRPQVIAKHDDA
ncbi:hypothetical protein D3C71_1971240 [compost metagenome]